LRWHRAVGFRFPIIRGGVFEKLKAKGCKEGRNRRRSFAPQKRRGSGGNFCRPRKKTGRPTIGGKGWGRSITGRVVLEGGPRVRGVGYRTLISEDRTAKNVPYPDSTGKTAWPGEKKTRQGALGGGVHRLHHGSHLKQKKGKANGKTGKKQRYKKGTDHRT